MSDFDEGGRRIPDYDEVEAAYWEKHPPLFWCEECDAPVTEDNLGCIALVAKVTQHPAQILGLWAAENGWCDECLAKWEAEQIADWKPLYEAEKRAGLTKPFDPSFGRIPR